MIFLPVRPERDIGRAILSGLRRPDTPPTSPDRTADVRHRPKGFLSMSVNTCDGATSVPVVRSRLLETDPDRSSPSLIGERHRQQAGRPIGSKLRSDSPAPDRPRPTLRRNTGHDPPPGKPAIRHFPGCGNRSGPSGDDIPRQQNMTAGTESPRTHPDFRTRSPLFPAAPKRTPPGINAPRPSWPRRRIRR